MTGSSNATWVTAAACNYLPQVRVLASSFSAHHPGRRMKVLITDTPPTGVDMSAEPYDVLYSNDVGIPSSWLMTHTRKELGAAGKPGIMLHALAHGSDSVIYVDPDSIILAPMLDVEEMVARHSITVSPHLLGPLDADDATGRFIEDRILEAGIYNGGMIGATGREEARAFLEWWTHVLGYGCNHDLASAQHFDQRWLEMLPSFVVNWGRFTDPGLNVSFWRIPEDELLSGNAAIDPRTSRHIHFSGFVPERPDNLVFYFPELLTVDDVPALAPAYREYATALERAGRSEWRSVPYGFGYFEDGEPIPDVGRQVYAQMGSVRDRFGDPFRSGAGSFQEWLGSAADDGHPVITREWAERHRRSEDLRAAFPEPLGAERAAFHAWTQTDEARDSRAIPYILFQQ